MPPSTRAPRRVPADGQWPADVDAFLRRLSGRAAAGILVETVEALACARASRASPRPRVYFGLNDFAISRGGGSLFRAVLDGSVARAREAFAATASASAASPPSMPAARALSPAHRGDGAPAVRLQLLAALVPARPGHPAEPARDRGHPGRVGECIARDPEPLRAITRASPGSSVSSPDGRRTPRRAMLARGRERLRQRVLVTGATGSSAPTSCARCSARLRGARHAVGPLGGMAPRGRVRPHAPHMAHLEDGGARPRLRRRAPAGGGAPRRAARAGRRRPGARAPRHGDGRGARPRPRARARRAAPHRSRSSLVPAGRQPHGEDDALEPTTVHGAAKAAASLLFRDAARTGRHAGVRAAALPRVRALGVSPPPAALRDTGGAGRQRAADHPRSRRTGLGLRGDVVDAIVRAVGLEDAGGDHQRRLWRGTHERGGRRLRRRGGGPARDDDRSRPSRRARPTPPHRRADRRKAERLLGWVPRVGFPTACGARSTGGRRIPRRGAGGGRRAAARGVRT